MTALSPLQCPSTTSRPAERTTWRSTNRLRRRNECVVQRPDDEQEFRDEIDGRGDPRGAEDEQELRSLRDAWVGQHVHLPILLRSENAEVACARAVLPKLMGCPAGQGRRAIALQGPPRGYVEGRKPPVRSMA